MNNIWVTSDTHFNHTNIIKYCNRPFLSSLEMDQVIINNWNNVIDNDDLVFHLGDFAFGLESVGLSILSKLKGKKILIRGNHDRDKIYNSNLWLNRFNEYQFEHYDIKINMSHYPQEQFNLDEIYLHGHSHGNLGAVRGNIIDVGVDCWEFKPINLDNLLNKGVQV